MCLATASTKRKTDRYSRDRRARRSGQWPHSLLDLPAALAADTLVGGRPRTAESARAEGGAGRCTSRRAARISFSTGAAGSRLHGKCAQRCSRRVHSSAVETRDRDASVPLQASQFAAIGRVLVRSTPADAQVFVDGRERGRTPATIRDLAPGAHRVKVVRDGYVTEDRPIAITAERPAQSVSVNLERSHVATAPRRAELRRNQSAGGRWDARRRPRRRVAAARRAGISGRDAGGDHALRVGAHHRRPARDTPRARRLPTLAVVRVRSFAASATGSPRRWSNEAEAVVSRLSSVARSRSMKDTWKQS